MTPPKRSGLGRGLASLIPTGPADSDTATMEHRMGDAAADVVLGGGGQDASAVGAVYREIAPSAIERNPRQPRQVFDEEALAELVHSIREFGLMQPIVVRAISGQPGGPRYQLVMGERRWRAAQQAGTPTIPALVRQTDDRDTLLLGIVDNVAREQLSPVEEARAYALLIDEFGLTLGEIGERVGRSNPAISNRVRLLELPEDVLGMVERGELSDGHARAVLAVPDNEGRRRLAREIVTKGLTVRAAERAARWAGAKRKPRREPRGKVDPALAERVRIACERATGFRPRVTSTRVEIPISDEHELAELAEALERAT